MLLQYLVAVLVISSQPPQGPSEAAMALWRGDLRSARTLAAAGPEERAYIDARLLLAEGLVEHAAEKLALINAADQRAVELAWRIAHARREPRAIAAAAARWCAAGDLTGRACVDAELFTHVRQAPSVQLEGATELPLAAGAPLPLLLGSVGGREAGVVLDTGASQTLLSASFARRLGLRATEASFPIGVAAGAAAAHARLALLPELVVGAAVVRNLPVLVMDAPQLDASGIAVVLSPQQAFDGLTVIIDYGAAMLRLQRAAAPVAGGVKYYAIGFDLAVEARIGAGARGLFGLDTGMEWSYGVSQAFSGGLKPRSGATVRGAGGQSTLALLEPARVEIGHLRLQSAKEGLLTSMRRQDCIQLAGILGNGLWSTGMLTLDTAHRVVAISVPAVEPGTRRAAAERGRGG